jgi:hypothetical protein
MREIALTKRGTLNNNNALRFGQKGGVYDRGK